jgi:hypothetical protein
MMNRKKVVMACFKELLQRMDGITEENQNIANTHFLEKDSESRPSIYVARLLTTTPQWLVHM